MSIKRRDTGRLDGKLEQGGLAAEAPLVASKSNIQGDFNVKRKVSKEILLKLKLHYMRTRTSEMVLAFLYGANMNDVQISFENDRLPARSCGTSSRSSLAETTNPGSNLIEFYYT